MNNLMKRKKIRRFSGIRQADTEAAEAAAEKAVSEFREKVRAALLTEDMSGDSVLRGLPYVNSPAIEATRKALSELGIK